MLKWNLSQQKYHSFQRSCLKKKKLLAKNQRTWVLLMILFFDANHVFFYQLLPTKKKHPPPALRGLRPLRLQSLRANAQALRATSVGSLAAAHANAINAVSVRHRNRRAAIRLCRRVRRSFKRLLPFVFHGECRWYIRTYGCFSLCLWRDLFHPS